MLNVAGWRQRIASVAVLALALGLAPWTAMNAAAACSPRVFSELGPAPNSVVQPPVSDPAPTDETPSTDASPAPAEPAPPPAVVTPPPPRCSFYYDMDYPVAGPSATLSVFGAVRDAGDRWHAGVDISAKKLTPVVAVHEGVIAEVNRNGEGDCCWVKVRHSDGWTSLYVHLNNDLFGTDDGTGTGIVRALDIGDPVERGQVIGYVGDSGNAEPGVPHLHFELRTRWGESVDPLPSLRRADRRGVSAFRDLHNPPYGFGGPFADVVEDEVGLVALGASLGLPLACDDYGLFFCGSDPADESTVAAWIDAFVTDRLNPTSWGTLLNEWSSTRDAEIERLMRLCGEECDETLSHDDLVVLLGRVESIPPDLLDVLYQDELLVGCDLPDEIPPVSRLQALRTLMRAFGYLEPPPPPPTPPCNLIA